MKSIVVITPEIRRLIDLALAEDLGRAGDLTTHHFLPRRKVRARIIARAPGIFCGGPVAAAVFARIAPDARLRRAAGEGRRVHPGQTLLVVSGPAALLSGERVALNFLQRLSGVATLTRRYADALRGTGVAVFDTRKTTPGWRALEKYAVRCGGGRNHRMGLYDAVMLKDNHLRLLRTQPLTLHPSPKGRGRLPPIPSPFGRGGGEGGALPAWAGGLQTRIAAFRRRYPKVEIEIEAQSFAEVRAALACGPDVIMLDNMSLSMLKHAIRLMRNPSSLPLPPLGGGRKGEGSGVRPLIEISGGVTDRNIRALAALGPDRISVGRLTHSAPAFDMSLEVDA